MALDLFNEYRYIFSMSADRLDCADSCKFFLECGTQVQKNNRDCIGNIRSATGATSVHADYPKRVELEKEGQPIGSVRSPFIWTDKTIGPIK